MQRMSKLNILRFNAAPLAICIALAAGASPAIAQSVPTTTTPVATTPAAETAHTDSGSSNDTIVVTGSIIRNPSAATASPVTSISSDDLLRRGQTDVSDALQTLSANNAGTIGSNWSVSGFATGASAVSLRGFNDGYTLTLFDGMRTAVYPLPDDGYRNIVDLNTIPESLVDRIEVLQDGASATYGSDAIAGVVNVIIKKEIQGLHLNASDGISQLGDAGERRFDATWGIGKLSEDGYNFYVNGEYQKDDSLFYHDRGYYNTSDLSGICGTSNGQGSVAAGQQTCENNAVRNGLQAGEIYNGFATTRAGATAPVDPATFTKLANYAYYPVGCAGLTSITLTPAQQASGAGNGPSTVCQQDDKKIYGEYLPKIERYGANARFTKNFGEHAQFFVMFNFAETKTDQEGAPLSFTSGQTAGAGTSAAGAPVSYANIFLPSYVCAQGVGSINAAGAIVASGCNAANGKLNPNNPYGPGVLAELYERSDVPTDTKTDNKTYRISGGLSGDLGHGWSYNLAGTSSWVNLTTIANGYTNLQSLLTAVATGSYNFADQSQNSAAAIQSIDPTDVNKTTSKLTQLQGSFTKELFTLFGTNKVELAAGASYRFESINAPSANAPNANPDDRYLVLNPFANTGSRRVWTGFYELNVPVTDKLTVKAEGSYDSYSTDYNASYSRFSPKFEAQFQLIKQIKLRGTYSRGFAVPSFVEAGNVLPAIGYVGTTINCAVTPAFCAAHASNTQYYQNASIGLGSSSNPNLVPQKSTSFTAGAVFEPTRHITLTVDYWHTKIASYILPVSVNINDLNTYYQTGQTVFADGTTILKGTPDAVNPSALPLALAVLGSYSNAQQEVGSGVDVTATARFPLGSGGLKWISQFNASYLAKLYQTESDGSIQAYAGNLSPCNISSCSGAPKLRGNWENTLDFNNKGSMTLTAYYTSGYEQVATDFGGVPGQCDSNTATGVPTAFADGATPVQCHTHATFDLDWAGSIKVSGHFTMYANILNVLNSKPPFDPSAQYAITQFNEAWGNANYIGRYFKVGAKVDF